MRIHRAMPLLSFLLAAAVLHGCGKKLDSRPLDRQIKIDGSDAEWQDARIYLDKIQASLGLLNDRDYLYLSMGLTDPDRQRQVLATGFTVWFDAEGKEGKTFGVRFPLGIRERLESMRSGAGGMRGMRGSIGGMGGGMGRGMGRGMGMGGGRGVFSRPEPLSHWVKIRLARPSPAL